MKLKVIDKKTGFLIYSCETEGDPLNPTKITESEGEISQIFKERMEIVWNGYSDIARSTTLYLGTGAYLIQHKVLNTINENDEELIVEDLPDYFPPDWKQPRGNAFNGN